MRASWSNLLPRVQAFPNRLLRKLRRAQGDLRDLIGALFAPTYSDKDFCDSRLFSYFRSCPQVSEWNGLFSVAVLYQDHYFDLLGSGWTNIRYGMSCRGLEAHRYHMPAAGDARSVVSRLNIRNRNEAARVRSLLDDGYQPIDWHLDFKSGFRWREGIRSRRIHIGGRLGVDIKVPWELARMQHLPQLALAYAALSKEPHPCVKRAEALRVEFRNQVLDFISSNPPRFGVNWVSTMDVAIRVANWLVAYDVFSLAGARFDTDFRLVFVRSVYEHGLHIFNNLEWSRDFRGNHYLSDIVGLLFVAAYLPRTSETDAWLALAVQELVAAVEEQFYRDGGNFEASTCYHRLAAELVVYATALVLGLPEEKKHALQAYDFRVVRGKPSLRRAPILSFRIPGTDTASPFPVWYWERLECMAEFTMHVTKPSGHVAQIGDNDSSRLFKFHPAYRKITVSDAKALYGNLDGYSELPDAADYWDEDQLDHRYFVSAINVFFSRRDFAVFAGESWIDSDIIRHWVKGLTIPSYRSNDQNSAAERFQLDGGQQWKDVERAVDATPPLRHEIARIPIAGGDLREGLKTYGYPDFGLYIFRSLRIFLLVRCGSVGQRGIGGHAHNDQLSIELCVDGYDLMQDPGTYLYTALPQRRNQYRSVQAHFAPRVEGAERAEFGVNLFQLGTTVSGECLRFCEEGIVCRHQAYGIYVYRSIRIRKQEIVICDWIEGGSDSLSRSRRPFWPASNGSIDDIEFSPGYGIRLRPTCNANVLVKPAHHTLPQDRLSF